MADLRQEKPGFVAWTSSLAFFISCEVCGFASIRQNAGLEARWSSGESRALVPASAGVRDGRLVQVLPAHARMIPESRYYRVYYCGALRACGDDLECDACRYVTKMAEQEDDACSREKFCRIVEHRWVELD